MARVTEVIGDLKAEWWDADLVPNEFRRLGYHAVAIIAEYFASMRDLLVFPGKTSQEVAEAIANRCR